MGWFSKRNDGFFLSTTTPPNIALNQHLGVVNGEAIIGANIFRDMFYSVCDVSKEELVRATKHMGASVVMMVAGRGAEVNLG